MTQGTEKQIAEHVQEYSAAQDGLYTIEQAEKAVNFSFQDELALIDVIKEQMTEKLTSLLEEMGVDKTSKEYTAVLAKVRKALFAPMASLVAAGHCDVEGKTYTPTGDYAVTLVEGKAKLERNGSLFQGEVLEAHKADVALLIAQGMFSSLEIKADKNTLAWMELRTLNALPNITSVVPVPQGYAKVKLT